MTYANAVVRGYQEQIALTRDDFVFLYAMLSYPEKFWKISNHYYNSKKTWVPPKMVEKLSNVVQQNQEKEKFLVKFKKNYLDLGE
jgi:beta-xylosidase